MTFDGAAVRLDGEHERATWTFEAAGDTQTIAWQWRRGEVWLSFCRGRRCQANALRDG